MEISQKSTINKLIHLFGQQEAKSTLTPMEPKLTLDKAENCDNNLPYRQLIGSLIYIASGTRPDINFATNFLSRFCNYFDETHFKYALRVLNPTIGYCLQFNVVNDNYPLECTVMLIGATM